MRTVRWILFGVAILAGIGIGLYYGWSVNPRQMEGGGLPLLRSDFRADYVLMVAEAYSAEKNLDLAARRLAPLGENPARQAQQAILTAGELGWSRGDVETLARLAQAFLTAQTPSGGSR